MIRTTTRSQLSFVTLCGLLCVLTGGCTQEPLCPELGECGGPPPLGTWMLAPGHPSCSEDLYIPPSDVRLLGAEVPTARQPVIEPAFFDWCLLLVTSGGKNILARPPRFFFESGPIGAATITYREDGRYTVGVSRTGTYTLDFPAACMRWFGATDGRPAINLDMEEVTGPVDVCKQLEVPLGESGGAADGYFFNTVCIANPDDPAGCLCQFEVTEGGGFSGTYQILGNTIVHLPFSDFQQMPFSDFPQKVSYCNKGGSLQLTGAKGNYLFGQSGLRTLDLVPATDPCANGTMDPSEVGVDCGGTCATACPEMQ